MIISQLNTTDLLSSLADTESALTELVSLFSQQQVNMIPFENSWTAGQLADHIIKVNASASRSLLKEGILASRSADDKSPEFEKWLLNFEKKYAVPDFVKPSDNTYNKETIIGDLKKSFEQLKQAGNAQNLSEMINHPSFGEVTKFEMIEFVKFHTQRHIHQLKKIAQALNIS